MLETIATGIIVYFVLKVVALTVLSMFDKNVER